MKYAQIFALGTILTLAITTLTGCASIKEKLGELWQKNKPQIELPVPTPEQTPEQTTDDEVDFSKLKWTRGGSNFSGAKREQGAIIRNVRIRVGGTPTLFYTGEGFGHWPKREPESNITHIWCTFFDEDGDGIYERGGKWDWGRANFLERPMHHMDFNYKNWDGYPKKGTPWASVITDVKGKRRSNVVKGVWP